MNIAIITAAGQGTRMDGGRAKQFLDLAGTPIIIHTLKRFDQCEDINELVVVLPASEAHTFIAFTEKYQLRLPLRVVAGGVTRGESVWCGLRAVEATSTDMIVVHDGVRPFVTGDEISRTIRAAKKTGAAVLVAPATDTIKEVQDGLVLRTLDRSFLRRALTPQCFHYEILRRAFEHAPNQGKDATDCSSLVERLNVAVSIVEGEATNIKITRPEDLAYGEILLKQDSGHRTQDSE